MKTITIEVNPIDVATMRHCTIEEAKDYITEMGSNLENMIDETILDWAQLG